MPPIPKPDPLGMPIPVAYLFVLRVFGFFLHMLFMHMWLAGLPVAVALWRFRPRVAERLIAAMPFAMAFGINAGIVPLLFLQTLYPQFFYPATILQAWFWFLVIPLLLAAYTAVYLAAFSRWRVLTSLAAAILLTGIGLQFSAAMALTATPDRWPGLFRRTAVGGAVHGFALALDLEAVLRLGLMAGMAMGTVAAFLAAQSAFHARDPIRDQIRPLVPLLYGIGLLVFGIAGLRYGPMVAGRLPGALAALAGGSMPVAFLGALAYARRPGGPRQRPWSCCTSGSFWPTPSPGKWFRQRNSHDGWIWRPSRCGGNGGAWPCSWPCWRWGSASWRGSCGRPGFERGPARTRAGDPSGSAPGQGDGEHDQPEPPQRPQGNRLAQQQRPVEHGKAGV